MDGRVHSSRAQVKRVGEHGACKLPENARAIRVECMCLSCAHALQTCDWHASSTLAVGCQSLPPPPVDKARGGLHRNHITLQQAEGQVSRHRPGWLLVPHIAVHTTTAPMAPIQGEVSTGDQTTPAHLRAHQVGSHHSKGTRTHDKEQTGAHAPSFDRAIQRRAARTKADKFNYGQPQRGAHRLEWVMLLHPAAPVQQTLLSAAHACVQFRWGLG